MSKKHQFQNDKDEHGDKLDPFHEMLQILDFEHLLRFRKRLEKVGRRKMVEILSTEIEEREEKEKAEAKAKNEAFEAERKERKEQEKKDKEKEKAKTKN